MSDVVARDKFHCPSCGADAHWNPSKQALVCPYCGTTAPATMDEAVGQIVEHDLVTALREFASDRRGWKTDRVSVQCKSCKAISVLDPNVVAQRCNFCGSAQIVPYEQIKPPISPESLLQFRVSETQVRDAVRQWYRTRWFAPNKLKTAALTDTVKGVYLPYWTFDARAHSDWTADSGYHYYVDESYTDNNGNRQTRRVQRTRWEPSSGHVEHFFDDELCAASRGVNPQLLREIEPFPTINQLIPYDAKYVAGWVVEQYQLDLIAAAQNSRAIMDRQMEQKCARQVPGDTYRNLDVETDYTNQTFKHILVPVWLLTFTYGPESYQVLINGFTGEIAGNYPKSWVKISLLIMVIGIIAVIFAVASRHR